MVVDVGSTEGGGSQKGTSPPKNDPLDLLSQVQGDHEQADSPSGTSDEDEPIPVEIPDVGDDDFAEPVRCPHGWYDPARECDKCPLPGEPGLVQVTPEEIERGISEFEYLITHGPGDAGFYLDPSRIVPDDVDRAKGLCAKNLLHLQRAIAVVSEQNLGDFDLLGPKSLAVLLANRVNYINHLPTRTFAWASSGEPFWFGGWDIVFGPTRRGKGRHLVFLRLLYGPAIASTNSQIIEVARFSLAGIFGSFDERGGFTDSDVIRSDHGLLLLHELGNIRAIFGGSTGSEAPGVLANFASSGTYAVSLKRGRHEYVSYAYVVGAIQLPAWDVIAGQVEGLAGRCVFAELPELTEDDARSRLLKESAGHPLDPLAVQVFAAKVSRLTAELEPGTFNYDAVKRRILHFLDHPIAGASFDISDLQRHVALTFGFHLATGGNITGDIVLPDPCTIPEARAAIEEDARIRTQIAYDPEERTVLRVDSLLRRSPTFVGTRATPLLHTRNDIVAFMVQKLGISSGLARAIFVGHRGRDGMYDSLEERKVVRREFPEWRDRIAEARAKAKEFGIDPEQATPAELETVRASIPRKRGRPSHLYVYVWAEDRQWTPERDEVAGLVNGSRKGDP